jgi:hypothetical protein
MSVYVCACAHTHVCVCVYVCVCMCFYIASVVCVQGTAGKEAEAALEMSALVNYIQPIHFHSFEASESQCTLSHTTFHTSALSSSSKYSGSFRA